MVDGLPYSLPVKTKTNYYNHAQDSRTRQMQRRLKQKLDCEATIIFCRFVCIWRKDFTFPQAEIGATLGGQQRVGREAFPPGAAHFTSQA